MTRRFDPDLIVIDHPEDDDGDPALGLSIVLWVSLAFWWAMRALAGWLL